MIQWDELYNDYEITLKTFVDDSGMVHYKNLKSNRGRLDIFINNLEKIDAQDFNSSSDNDKIAFWINAYNALTLKVIIDNYPIKSSFFTSLRYPDNSIRQISGVWDTITFSVMGTEITLDYIEHEILRKQFDEPRIHIALVCAAMGCPPLRKEPYTGSEIDEQFDDQAGKFLDDPLKFRIDSERKKIYMSSIFNWFGEDFVSRYDTKTIFQDYKAEERAVLHFISRYLSASQREVIQSGSFDVSYLDYDWSLNEQ